MTVTTVSTANQAEIWDADFFSEYVRFTGFKPYMSADPMSVITVKSDLLAVGKVVNIPLITRLTGAGVTGNSALEGAEEALGNYNHQIAVAWRRNAVAVTEAEEHWTPMDLRRAARAVLKDWAMGKLRADIIAALSSIWDGSSAAVAYASATAAQRDLWLDRSYDRVQFGRTRSNISTSAPAGGATYDHSASLSNIATDELLNAASVGLMKRLAKNADPHIRPMRVEDGREYFVMFVNTLAMRDLKNDTTIAAANREARPRDVERNPIFQDGDLIYDGVIIREIPEIPVLTGVGGSSGDVSPVYLCGAQALGIAWARETQTRTDVRDYGFVHGVGIQECVGVNKLVYNNEDHGVVTGFFATPADA